MNKYYVYCRYEYISDIGKKFTDWYRIGGVFDTEEDANKEIENISSTSKDIDKHTKMKHEYEVRYLDETLMPQIKMKRPKGRPKKPTQEELRVFIKALNNKGSIKIDGTMKEYIYNDEESKKYIQEHIKDKDTKWVRYWYDDNDDLYMILKDNSEKIYE